MASFEVVNPLGRWHRRGSDGTLRSRTGSFERAVSEKVQRFYQRSTRLRRLVGIVGYHHGSHGIYRATVAGNYWFCLYDVLEAKGLEVCLVNARHMKNVSGRKSDVSDSHGVARRWLLRLHTYGLLSASFIPDQQIRELRCYVRQRDKLEKQKAKDLQMMGSSLTNMNIKLQQVVSDIEGETAMRILRAIASGVADAQQLASHRHSKMKASQEELAQSLTGNFQSEHLFCLRQALASYDGAAIRFHRQQMSECETEIERLLAIMQAGGHPGELPEDFQSKPKSRKTRKNQYRFELAGYLQACLGVDATRIDGLDENTVLEVIAETGTDLSKWKTAKHFTSWLRLAPNPAVSAGKVLYHKGHKTSSRAARAFRLAARSLHSHKGYLGQLYRRLCLRKGPSTAIKAVARKLAVIFYTMITEQQPYQPRAVLDQIAENQRQLKKLKRQAQQKGYKLVPA